MKVEAGLMRKW